MSERLAASKSVLCDIATKGSRTAMTGNVIEVWWGMTPKTERPKVCFFDFIRSFIAFAIIGTMMGCMSEPKTYAYSIIVAGGPSGWPVWVEEVTLNGDRRVPAGAISYGYDQTPPTGGRVVMGSSTAPEFVEARWFSHRTGKFHEILLSMPEGFEKSLSTWFDRYPTPAYRHYFIVGFSGKGEALAWWRASCTDCENDQGSGFAVPIIISSLAQTVGGDPSGYDVQVQYYIDKGVIPPVK